MGLKKSVLVKLGLDDKEFSARLKGATTKLNKASSTMMRDGRRLGRISSEIFTGLTLPLAALGANVFKSTKELDRLRQGLSLIAQSRGIQGIGQLIKDVEKLAKLPGLGLEETFKGVQQLLSLGLGKSDALAVVEGLGIGIARAGGSAEEFDRVMRQLTQGLAKGKLEMQDFKTIFEQMPESRRLLEEAFGPGMADLEKLRKSGVSVQQVVFALANGFKKLGAGGLLDSLSNQWENLSDSWKKLSAAFSTNFLKDKFSFLGLMAKHMDHLTSVIERMSPGMKRFIGNIVTLTAKVSVFLPLTGFLISRFKLVGGFLLKYSTLARGAAIATGLLGSSVKSLGFARMLVSLRNLGRVGATTTATILGLGRAVAFVGRAVRVAIPIIGELYIAYELLKAFIPDLNKQLKTMAKIVSVLAIQHFPALASAINWVSDLFKKTEEKADGVTGRMEALRKRGFAGGNLQFIKDWKPPLDTFNKGLEKTIVNLEKLSEIKLDRLGRQLGVFSLGSGFVQTSSGAKIDPFPGLDTGMAALGNSLSGLGESDEIVAGFQKISQYVETGFVPMIWMAQQAVEYLSQGLKTLNPIAGAFSNILGSGLASFADVVAQIPAGLKSVGKAFGDAVKDMLVKLVALIAKLAIAATLMSIIFPGAGGLKALAGGTGSFGLNGLNFGKGDFLKNLFGSMGIPGFAEGGIVNRPTLGIFGEAGPEAIMPLPYVEKLANSGGGPIDIRLNGIFRIQGRDLVYVLEENQAMVNSVRGNG